ncbi:hypothetical protein MOQ_007161 [Trypanosoma cruzi marinkellei]|uniref:Uncharacterized protein n=1 Tax=Trypanosoma cruzi marinkellei TaxID=85056 RepID=K2N395_TRYCR|nr:hypothetical protein MOQ_007161 [Trypanosoma cruzi marinkellei]
MYFYFYFLFFIFYEHACMYFSVSVGIYIFVFVFSWLFSWTIVTCFIREVKVRMPTTEAFSTGEAAHMFRPKINRNSRRLVSGSFSVEERQKNDIMRRERHRQELLSRAEEERQRIETFAPVTNPRVRRSNGSVDGQDNSRTALIRKVHMNPTEETFHPVINSKSQRMVANGTWQSSHQQSQEVFRRVRALWRTHAGVGTGEITLGGVYAALQEIGLQVPSAVADKFLLALNLDESAGRRCVPYDRFVKVFTTVLRAALIPVAVKHNAMNDDSHDDGDNAASPGGEEKCKADETLHSRSVSSQGPVPTMRLAKRLDSTTDRRGITVPDASQTNTSRASAPVLQRPLQMKSGGADAVPFDGEVNSPSPTAPSCSSRLRNSVTGDQRIFEESPGLSHSPHPRLLETTKKKKTTYDPLEGCTFVPTINKRVKVVSSTPLAAKKEGNEDDGGDSSLQAKGKSSIVVYKSKEERELEECTFAPNTARFHKDRDSLAWWTREPFVGAGTEPKAASASGSFLTSEDPSVKGDAEEDKEEKQGKCRRSSSNGRWHQQAVIRNSLPLPIAMGFDKAVQRMLEARKKARPKFEEMLRVSTEESHKPLQPTVVEPFSLQAEARHLYREQQKPVLYVDVDLPSGKTGRIGVHRGDEAAVLAKRFGDTYGLNEELRQRLELLLAEKLRELLKENGRTLWL